MGGLYSWVCKMKPDQPILGCTSLLLNVALQFFDAPFSLCRFSIGMCSGSLTKSHQTGWIYSIAMVFTGTSGNLRFIIIFSFSAEQFFTKRSL